MRNQDEALIDALSDLKAEILTNGFRVGLVEEIANEYGLHPKLLKRKFEETTNQTLEEYHIRQDLPDGPTFREDIAAVEQARREMAREYAKNKIKKQGMTVKAYKEKYGEAKFEMRVSEGSKHPKVIELAKTMVELNKKLKTIKP